LEAESYNTYVARLRDIGCPESTIRDIIIGELKAAAADKRAELERKILHSSDWSPPPGVSRQEYFASQTRKMDREIERTAGDLMAAAPGSPAGASASGQQQDNKPPVRYPVAMADVTFEPSSSGQVRYVDSGVVEAPQGELAAIQQIQERFVQDIGGPNQDAEDPQYEHIWRSAQWKADQVFRARYGWGAYGDVQRAAAQKAFAEQQKAATGQ
jgi:hypothetical protein